MPSRIQIICRLSDTMHIGLAAVRENMGHDDSQPYQAEIHIADQETFPSPKKDKLLFSKVGRVYNDGWGGMSQVSAEYSNDKEKTATNIALLNKAKELCRKHTIHYEGRTLGPYSLDYLCDIMAENYLNLPAKTKKKTVFYMFDDEPEVLADSKHRNLYTC